MKPIQCIICNKVIQVLFDDNNIDTANFSNGVVGKISAGFGSKHDGDVYLIGICDDCIDHRNIKPIDNYIFGVSNDTEQP